MSAARQAKKRSAKEQASLFPPGTFPDDARVSFVGHLNRPPVPEGWHPPTCFPAFSDAKRVTIDYETYDPELKTIGSGVLRGTGYTVGVGVQIEDEFGGDTFAEYYPMRHDYGENCNPEGVEAWLRDNLRNFRGEICGANSNMYDGMYNYVKGIEAPLAKWRDVQWAEPLLDENAYSYGLDTLCKKYGLEKKVKHELNEKYGKKWIEHFQEIHPAHARSYVLGDLDRPSKIIDMQMARLEQDGLMELFDVESRLTPMLHYMRATGVRVDKTAASNFNDDLIILRDAEFEKLSARVNMDINMETYGKRDVLQKMFDTLGIAYPYTAPSKKHPSGQPSFTKAWLDGLTSDAARELTAARSYEKSRSTFVEGYILNCILGDRVHCEFHPCKYSDDSEGEGGTETGRFSSSNPNLQNIPVRDPFLGPILRSMFLPEPGAQWWSIDYSQIEYRFLIHFAVAAALALGEDRIPGAFIARDAYLRDPKTDFHTLTAQLMEEPLVKVLLNSVWKGTLPHDWKKLVRKIAKNINFGLVYGMGVDKLSVALGLAEWSEELQKFVATQPAKDIINTYHEMNPYIRPLNKLATAQAQNKGFTRTFLGRRRHFDFWELNEFGKKTPAYFYDEACRMYGEGNIKRAGTHKALNSVLQGSAADMMKAAMVKIWEAGIFDKRASNDIWLHLTVHDELDGSVLPTERGKKALAEIQNIMQNTFQLHVPVLAELGLGPTWHEAH